MVWVEAWQVCFFSMQSYQRSAAEQDHEDDKALEPAVLYYSVAGFSQRPPHFPPARLHVYLAALEPLHAAWGETKGWWGISHFAQKLHWFQLCQWLWSSPSKKQASGSIALSSSKSTDSPLSPPRGQSTVLPSEELYSSSSSSTFCTWKR